MEEIDKAFSFYTKDVLGYYSLHAHAYKIEMNGVSGRISSRNIDFDCAGLIPVRIKMFGLRKLSNNTHAVALWFKDYMDMPDEHKTKWDVFRINNPILSNNDIDFDNYYRRYWRGSWARYPQPLSDLKKKLEEISEITTEFFNVGLFDYVENPNLIYPLSEHKAQYLNSCLGLYKLFDLNINVDCLTEIAKSLDKDVQKINGNVLRINTLKEFLPKEIQDKIIKPIHNLRDARGKMGHEIALSEPYSAHEKFHEHVLELNGAMAELIIWLKQATDLLKQ